MQIFKKNDFFVGVSLPEPEVMDPLEEKLAKSVTPEGLDFALVINERAPEAELALIKISLMSRRNVWTRTRASGGRATN